MLQEVAQEIKNTIGETLQNVHTAIPGKIAAYDPAKGEADILPFGKFKKPSGEYMDYPQLHSVPILFPQSCGQDFSITYPVNPGDGCLVLIQEQTLDVWRGAGASSDNDLRFDLSNAVAIVGLFASPPPSAVEAQGNNAMIIKKSGHRIVIDPAGVTITAPTTAINGNLNVSGDVDITGTLTLAGINMNTHTHGGVVAGSDNTDKPQ
jgi:hypothetical protein